MKNSKHIYWRDEALKRFLMYIMLALILNMICMPAFAYDPYVDDYLYGKNGSTTLYDNPDGKIIAQLFDGLKVWYNGDLYPKNGWVKIELANSTQETIIGWIRQENLLSIRDSQADEIEYNYTVGIITKSVKVEYATNRFGNLLAGIRVLLLGENDTQYYISILGTQGTGWVEKDSIITSQEKQTLYFEPETHYTRCVYGNGKNSVPIHLFCSSEYVQNFIDDGTEIEVVQELNEWTLIKIVKVAPLTGTRTWYCRFIENRFLEELGDHTYKTKYIKSTGDSNRVLLRLSTEESLFAYKAKFFSGTPIVLLNQQEEWCYVRIGKNIYGYIQEDYISENLQRDRTFLAYTVGDIDLRVDNGQIIYLGTQVTLLGGKDDKMLFMLPDGNIYSASIDKFSPVDDYMNLTAKVTSSSLIMHIAPNQNSEMITSINKNMTVTVRIQGDIWCQIEYNENVGYVMTKYLKFDN